MVITIRRYEVGEVIVREHEWGDTAYIIEQGQVEVSKALDGQPVHLANLGAGDAVGEMSRNDEKPSRATVPAVTETVVRESQRDAFFHSLQTDSDVARAIGRSWRRRNVKLGRVNNDTALKLLPSQCFGTRLAPKTESEMTCLLGRSCSS